MKQFKRKRILMAAVLTVTICGLAIQAGATTVSVAGASGSITVNSNANVGKVTAEQDSIVRISSVNIHNVDLGGPLEVTHAESEIGAVRVGNGARLSVTSVNIHNAATNGRVNLDMRARIKNINVKNHSKVEIGTFSIGSQEEISSVNNNKTLPDVNNIIDPSDNVKRKPPSMDASNEEWLEYMTWARDVGGEEYSKAKKQFQLWFQQWPYRAEVAGANARVESLEFGWECFKDAVWSAGGVMGSLAGGDVAGIIEGFTEMVLNLAKVIKFDDKMETSPMTFLGQKLSEWTNDPRWETVSEMINIAYGGYKITENLDDVQNYKGKIATKEDIVTFIREIAWPTASSIHEIDGMHQYVNGELQEEVNQIFE